MERDLEQQVESILPPPPILTDSTVVLSSEKLEDLPCFDRASIDAALSVNANRVWLPDKEVYLGSVSWEEAIVQLEPLVTTTNAKKFQAAVTRGEAIERGSDGDASPEFRANLGKRVVAECVIRLAHSAGLLKKGDGCVILPTAGEVEAHKGGSGASAGASVGAPGGEEGQVAGYAGEGGGEEAQPMAAPARNRDNIREGYDPRLVVHVVGMDIHQHFLTAPITGALCEVPGIGPMTAGLLGEGEGEDSIKNTFQLIGKFLVLRGSKEDGKLIDCVEHCNKFYWWLQSKGIVIGRGRIVQCVAEKVNLSYPGIYDPTAWDT